MSIAPGGVQSTTAGSGGGMFDWFRKMSPENQAALIQGGTGLLGGVLGGIGEGQRDEANRQFQYDQLAFQERNADANRALQAAQSDPLATQTARQRAAIMYSLLPGLRNAQVSSNIPGMNHFIPQVSGGLRLPEGGIPQEALAFSTPSAMANAEAQHWRQLGLDSPDLSSLGYGQAGTDAMNLAASQPRRGQSAAGQAIQRTVGGKPPKGYEYDKKTGQLKKKGGGFWKTLGKIASVAAPIVAAPFTGGTSLALIGAGAGAAQGALSGGGWRGALMGAGMGAIPGVGGASGAAGGATSALGKIGQSLTTPQALLRMGGAATPGTAGQVMNYASMFAPSGSLFGPKAGPTVGPVNTGAIADRFGPSANPWVSTDPYQEFAKKFLPGGAYATPTFTR